MNKSTRRQIKSGLRLGGGLAVFLVALLPLVDGVRRVVWAATAHQLTWSPIGFAELIMAAALLLSTAKIWVQWLAGCMLFACIKGFVVFLMDSPLPRIEAAKLIFVCLITLLLMVSLIRRGVTLLDRIAFTIYVFSLGWNADNGLFTPSPPLVVGLASMFASWCIHSWKDRGIRRVSPRPGGA